MLSARAEERKCLLPLGPERRRSWGGFSAQVAPDATTPLGRSRAPPPPLPPPPPPPPLLLLVFLLLPGHRHSPFWVSLVFLHVQTIAEQQQQQQQQQQQIRDRIESSKSEQPPMLPSVGSPSKHQRQTQAQSARDPSAEHRRNWVVGQRCGTWEGFSLPPPPPPSAQIDTGGIKVALLKHQSEFNWLIWLTHAIGVFCVCVCVCQCKCDRSLKQLSPANYVIVSQLAVINRRHSHFPLCCPLNIVVADPTDQCN